MPAFEAAVRCGADAIELDVQLTRDEVPVVYHDRTLFKLDGSRRRVAERSFDELRHRDFSRRRGARYRGIGVPSLAQVLDELGGRIPLMLEIKADGERPRSARWRRLVDGVVDAVQRRALARHVHVLSFDAEVLALVGRRAPELPRVWNVDAPVEWSPVFQRRLAKVGTLCLPARFATATLGRRLQEQDRALWVYRCDTEHALLLARRSGATMLITDDPAWLRRRLRETASVR